MQKQIEIHEKRVSEWNRGIISGILDLKKRLSAIKNDKRKYYKNAHPLIVIYSLTVQDLPTSQILELVLINDLELRKEKQDRFIRELKSKCYHEWKNDLFDNLYLT